MSFLNGKKTYIVAALIFALTVIAALHQFGIMAFELPNWSWTILAALGLGTLKAAIPDPQNVQLTGLAQQIFATKWGKYLVSVLLAAAAAVQAAQIPIPEFIWMGFNVIGFTSLRANTEVAKNIDPNA